VLNKRRAKSSAACDVESFHSFGQLPRIAEKTFHPNQDLGNDPL